MKISARFLVIGMVIATILCSPVWAEFTATKTDENIYEFNGKQCTLDEALNGLYENGKAPFIACLNDARFYPDIKQSIFKKKVPDSLKDFGFGTNSKILIGSVTVFYPYPLCDQPSYYGLIEGQLLASLTPDQLDVHSANQGIPYSALTAEQQSYVSSMVQNARFVEPARGDGAYVIAGNQNIPSGSLFPEPILTQLLQQSKLIIGLRLTVNYKENTRNFTAIYNCDEQAHRDLWSPWQKSMKESRRRLSPDVQNEPGEDIPGTGEEITLSGVYRLGDLVNEIQNGYPGIVRCDASYANLQIAAYCKITKAGLSRALAITSGAQWSRTGSEWKLAAGAIADMLAYHYVKGKSFEAYKKREPIAYAKRLEMIKSGKLILIADKIWHDSTLQQDMLSGNPVDLTKLSPAQMAVLQDQYEKSSVSETYPTQDIYGCDKITWGPRMELYIATKNTILYQDSYD